MRFKKGYQKKKLENGWFTYIEAPIPAVNKDSFTNVSKKVYDYILELENENRDLKRLLKKSDIKMIDGVLTCVPQISGKKRR